MLASRYLLRDGCVLEIGADTGEFLELLCSAADSRGVGVDPSARGRLAAPGRRVTLVAEPFHARHCSPPPALVLCRHTLEHLPHPGELLDSLARGLGPGSATPIVFEVPEALRILHECAFWDVYYEHVNYFTPGGLARLFARAGFSVCELSLAFDDQYILLHASLGDCPEPVLPPELDSVRDVEAAAEAFALAVERSRACWDETVGAAAESGRRVVLWGSGSKATGFLAALSTAASVSAVVDVNPHKQGRFVAGTGHPIVAPAALAELRPGLVIVMNPAYRDEISTNLDHLGVEAEILAL